MKNQVYQDLVNLVIDIITPINYNYKCSDVVETPLYLRKCLYRGFLFLYAILYQNTLLIHNAISTLIGSKSPKFSIAIIVVGFLSFSRFLNHYNDKFSGISPKITFPLSNQKKSGQNFLECIIYNAKYPFCPTLHHIQCK